MLYILLNAKQVKSRNRLFYFGSCMSSTLAFLVSQLLVVSQVILLGPDEVVHQAIHLLKESVTNLSPDLLRDMVCLLVSRYSAVGCTKWVNVSSLSSTGCNLVLQGAV